MAKKKKQYIALVGLTNDKGGKQWAAGDTLSEGDFTKKQFADFLKIEAIKEAD